MANFGKVCFLVLVLLFMLRAASSGVLTFVLSVHQEFAIEEIYDHQESDDQFELKFLDDSASNKEQLRMDIVIDKLTRGYKSYNEAIFHGFIKLAFKPPSVA